MIPIGGLVVVTILFLVTGAPHQAGWGALLWAMAAPIALLVIFLVPLVAGVARARPPYACQHCQYDLRGLRDAGFAPSVANQSGGPRRLRLPSHTMTNDDPMNQVMAAMDDASIASMEPNARFAGTFAISNTQVGKTRKDKPYLRCLLSDATGTAPGRMWGASEELIKRLPSNGFVYCEGQTQPYQGELQLIIERIEEVTPTAEQLKRLLPVSARDPQEMYGEVIAILETLTHPAAKALAQEIVSDDMLMDMFRHAPAAKMMHHAYIGGLCEHTLSLLNVANAILPWYPKVNRDIVLLALFLHDMGKTREMDWNGAFDYTDRGHLIGHIVDGVLLLHDKAQSAMTRQGIRFPRGFITVLEHCILSSHTLPEHGSPKAPSTPEAIMVAMLDNLDAKMAAAIAAGRPDGDRGDLGGNFTERIWALDTRLYRPDPLA